MLYSLAIWLHVVICIFLVLIVLLQQGKGADAGATFGGGGNANTMFGASSADTFMTKLTTSLALLFMVTSVMLAIGSRKAETPEGRLFRDTGAQSQTVDVINNDTGTTETEPVSADAVTTETAAEIVVE